MSRENRPRMRSSMPGRRTSLRSWACHWIGTARGRARGREV
jgi:hypothetical protein